MAHGFYRWVGQDRNVTEAQYVSSGKSLSGSDLYGWCAGNSFYRDDIREEYKQLTEEDVSFKGKPIKNGSVWVAIFDDSAENGFK